MIQISPTIRLFTYQETNESGLQIKSLVFSHNCNNYHLQGSTGATIYIFTEGLGIYVLTINKTAGYIGLNCYMAPEPDYLNTICLHSNQEIIEILGKKWEQIKPEAITKRLIEYLY